MYEKTEQRLGREIRTTRGRIAVTVMFMAATTGTAAAQAVPCEPRTMAGFTSVCTYGESGNYSQLNTELFTLSDDLENAGLCVPAAAAGALDQLLDRTNARAGTWIALNFEPKSRKQRIINVAPKVSWQNGVGSSNAGWFNSVAADIDVEYTGHVDSAQWSLLAPQVELFDNYFLNHLTQGAGLMLLRAKYKETCAYDLFNRRQCNYTEDTDTRHAQAVNGSMQREDDAVLMTRIWQSHNASGVSSTAVADEQIRDFRRLPIHGVDDHRPNGSFTSFFWERDDVYTIVSRVHRITTR